MRRARAWFPIALAVAVLAPAARSEDAPERVIRYADDRLTVHVSKAPASEVVEEIGRASGAEIRGGVLPHDVTAEFDDVPVSQGLHRILDTQNFLLKYGEGDRLRAIVLLGGPTVVVSAPQAAATTTAPASPLTLQQALAAHPPIPVSGPLAAALGTNTSTVDQLLQAALRQDDPRVREQALRMGLEAIENDATLRTAFLSVVNKVDDAAVGNALRGMSAEHAEEFVAAVASHARSSELRIKASAVLQQIRAPHGG